MTVGLSACVAGLSLATSAVAQAPAPQQAAAPAVEEMVVTGSRIARPLENSPVPLTILDATELRARGITQAADALATVPALLGTDSIAESIVGAGSAGLPTVNLRNLGIDRTLVLVNGRRHVAGEAGSAAVDISTIPRDLIERIDVVTGGASAVYGSDAVTGVVNYILKKDFEGTTGTAQVDFSEHFDAVQRYGSVTVGRNFGADKRTNLTISVSGEKRDELDSGDRSFSRNNGIADDYANPDLRVQETDLTPELRAAGVRPGAIILRQPAGRLPQSLIDRAQAATARAYGRDPRFAISALEGQIGFDLDGDQLAEPAGLTPFVDFDNNGVDDCAQSFVGRSGFGCLLIDRETGRLRPFQDGIIASGANQFGGDGVPNSVDRSSLVPETEGYVFDFGLRHEFNQYFVPFLEAKYTRFTGRETAAVQTFDDAIIVSLENPFIPAELRSVANAAIAADPSIADTFQFLVNRDWTDLLDPNADNRRRTFRIVGGFEGALDNGWDYETAINYGRTRQLFQGSTRLEDRFFSALDAVRDPRTGQPVCRSTLDPTALPPNSTLSDPVTAFNTFNPADGTCRPLNVFGVGASSQEARDFVGYEQLDTATIEQFVASASISGDTEQFFSLPGGPVQFAAGGEYRQEKSDFQADPFDAQDFTFGGGTQSTVGQFDVMEGFVEVNVPLLADLPFAETLSVDAAVRFGDYSTVGFVNTWKAGGVYAPVQDIRFRGGYSSTIRAPNIAELFQPQSIAFFRPVDPCEDAQISVGPNPANRLANCRADGIPAGFVDPLTARFEGTEGGNPNLSEESSISFTGGIVLTPRWLPGLSVTADYWDIRIEDAIAFPTAQNVVDNCYDAPSLDNQFCALFTRNRNSNSATFLGEDARSLIFDAKSIT